MDLTQIKFVVSEVDGIVTEHLTGLGEMGITMFKQFNMKDFEAVNLLKKDWGFAFLSSDAAISMTLCKKRNIPFFLAERSKKDVIGQLLRRYNLTADEILYVGSSYSDLDCMRMAGFSMCPEDAVTPVKNTSDVVIPYYSGAGVLCYVYEFLVEQKQKVDRE